MIQAKKGDDKHSIAALAVEQGELQKAINFIKGQHAKRILLVIDEAESTPEAIFHCIPNLRKSCQDFTLLVIGNSTSHLDGHGRVCEPAQGWNSITVEDEQWETKGVSDWQIPPGVCLHFDGFKSPNVAKGRTVYPYIYTWEDYQNAIASDMNSLGVWTQDRGFWAPEGTCNTVMSETLVEKHTGYGDFTFLDIPTQVASLDPAFGGGNECIFTPGQLGRIEGGRLGLRLLKPVAIKINATSAEPAEYQIASRVRKECAKRRVQPQHFCLDSTGTGRGIGSVLQREWSQDIKLIDSTTAATDRPVSDTDSRPAKDRYDRRASELQFSARAILTAGQLRGLSMEAVREFSAREYIERNGKVRVSTKEEVVLVLGHSPDYSDGVSLLVDLCRDHGLVASPLEGNTAVDDSGDSDADVEQMLVADQHAYLGDGIEYVDNYW
jgi:hypothetical protein